MGADEHDAVAAAQPGKVGVFGEKAVAGMDGLGAGYQRRGDYAVLVQIALRRVAGADAVAFVGHGHVEHVLVSFGIHRHGGDAHLLAGADYPDGDLAAVGYEDL